MSEKTQSRTSADQAAIIYKQVQKVRAASNNSKPTPWNPNLPCLSKQRRINSLREGSFHVDNGTTSLPGGSPDTVLYLAYGSNLSAQTFQGTRGIRPLSQVNVVVPELVMTFDLAGIPYVEPCFANTKYRHPSLPPSTSEKSHLLPKNTPEYHKNRWKKGLVGVVYEVTQEDYAHIIATEGGGSSYQDVLVDCYELPLDQATVPEFPASPPFKAHTLYSPISPPGETPENGGRFSRPDPAYAQPSLRYLKLLTDGADEHALPGEYKKYLHQLRPYTMTTQKQRLGGWIFGMIWLPIISSLFGLNRTFADEDGKAPAWLVAVVGAMFRGMWTNYDTFFSKTFGDGERTIYKDEDEDDHRDTRAVPSRPHSKDDYLSEKGYGGYSAI